MSLIAAKLKRCVNKMFILKPFMSDYFSHCHETQEMSKKVASREPFLLKYCLDKHKSQELYKNVNVRAQLIVCMVTSVWATFMHCDFCMDEIMCT